MIPMPGLEVAVYAFFTSLGLAVFALVLGPCLYFLARRNWAQGRAAVWPLRIAFAQTAALGVWALLTWGAWGGSVLALVLGAVLYGQLAGANERAGFSGPALLWPGLSGVLALVLALAVLRIVLDQKRQADAAEDARRTAEGQKAQDRFDGLWVASPSRIAIVGTTSTPPSQDDDAWLCLLDAPLRQVSCEVWRTPGDQLGAVVAPIGDDWLVGGHSDDRPLLVRWSSKSPFPKEMKRANGWIRAASPAGDGQTLLGGGSDGQAWLTLLDTTGASAWWQPVATKVDSPAVVSIATQGTRFVAAGVDSVFGRGSFLSGGALDQGIAWAKDVAPGADSQATLCCVRNERDGAYQVLGAARAPDALEDLWTFRVDDVGTVSDERTFGEKLGEAPGGVALAADRLILAATRFTGAEDELWLHAAGDDGQVAWSRTLPQRAAGRANAIERLPDGTFIIVGHRTTGSKSDGWIALFAAQGDLVWQKTLP